MYLEEENERMRNRITSAEASVKVLGFETAYQKHLYYKSRMQKFYADECNTIKLKYFDKIKSQGTRKCQILSEPKKS